MLIGVVSDTHGYLDPRALAALRGAEHILHAGDVGDEAILRALEQLAPVSAVSGNIDAGTPLGRRLPGVLAREFAGVPISMTHIGGRPQQIAARLPTPRPRVYIFGHSHIALLEQIDDVLFLNPGAAGRPRFGGGLSVALLALADQRVQAQIIPL